MECVKQQKQGMIGRYGKSDDIQGVFEVLLTLVPLALLWWFAVLFGHASYWYVLAALPLLILFTLRVFALMHECGHRSLFRSVALNRWVGFALGVISGMPRRRTQASAQARTSRASGCLLALCSAAMRSLHSALL